MAADPVVSNQLVQLFLQTGFVGWGDGRGLSVRTMKDAAAFERRLKNLRSDLVVIRMDIREVVAPVRRHGILIVEIPCILTLNKRQALSIQPFQRIWLLVVSGIEERGRRRRMPGRRSHDVSAVSST